MKKTTRRGDILETLSLHELCRFCQSDEDWVVELVAQGVLEPAGSSMQSWRFQGQSISRAKKASRLNRDLGINAAGVAMVLELLEERDRILRQLAHFEAY